MIHNKHQRLIIDMSDLCNFSLDLARRVIKNPGEYIQPFSDALTEVIRNVDPKYLKEVEHVLIGFEGPFGFHRVIPRDLYTIWIYWYDGLRGENCYQIDEVIPGTRWYRKRHDVIGCPPDNSRYVEEEDDAGANASIFVKYNRMLHGEKRKRGQKRETLTIKFLKKYIHYTKNRMQPKLTDEASDNICNCICRTKECWCKCKVWRGHASNHCKDLRNYNTSFNCSCQIEVEQQDVEAALKVLNFAIYHKELTETEEREQERERTRQADHDSGAHHGRDATRVPTQDPMEVDGSSVPQPDHLDNSAERMEMFSSLLGRHMAANNRLDSLPISAIEGIVNSGAAVPYSQEEIESLLETLQNINRLMIFGGEIRVI